MNDPSRFFGWRIVLLGLLLNAIGSGLIGVYAFMVTPLISEFDASPGELGMGMSVAIVSMTLAAPLIGPILDRGPMRLTMFSGIGLMLSALVLLAQCSALWQMALCLPVAAIGISMFGMMPAKVLIVNWFVRKRGKALAVAYAGTSLAGLFMPPAIAWLIELTSWRGALVCVAIGAAAIALPATAVLAVRRPEDIGASPDGDAAPPAHPVDEAAPPAVRVASLTRQANFWLLGLGDAMALCVPLATSVFVVRHLEELGIPRTQVALAMPVMAAFALTGKLSAGVLADRRNPKLLVVAAILLHAAGLALVAIGTSLEQILCAMIPMGLGGGALIPMPGILQGRCFGRMVIGRISGLHSLIALPFMLGVTPLVGLGASSSGSFVLPFFALGAIQVLAAGVLGFLRLPDVEPGKLDPLNLMTPADALAADAGGA